jgi:hypothetical protein
MNDPQPIEVGRIVAHDSGINRTITIDVDGAEIQEHDLIELADGCAPGFRHVASPFDAAVARAKAELLLRAAALAERADRRQCVLALAA